MVISHRKSLIRVAEVFCYVGICGFFGLAYAAESGLLLPGQARPLKVGQQPAQMLALAARGVQVEAG